jgi:hypothetical protein
MCNVSRPTGTLVLNCWLRRCKRANQLGQLAGFNGLQLQSQLATTRSADCRDPDWWFAKNAGVYAGFMRAPVPARS